VGFPHEADGFIEGRDDFAVVLQVLIAQGAATAVYPSPGFGSVSSETVGFAERFLRGARLSSLQRLLNSSLQFGFQSLTFL
jgi:hypothetical protein